MRINGFQCDTCGKLHPLGLYNDTTEQPPAGWITLSQSPHAEWFHFCSLSHLYQWSTNQLTANDIPLTQGDKA